MSKSFLPHDDDDDDDDLWYRYGVANIIEENFSFVSGVNAVVKDVQAVQLCSSKILQFLTVGACCHRLTCVMGVKPLLLKYECCADCGWL